MSEQSPARSSVSAQSPVLLSAEPAARRRRINGWELALWLLGVGLLIASTVLWKHLVDLTIAESQGRGQSTTDPAFVQEILLQEASSLYGPGIVTGAIICIALAIFLRALDISARRRAVPLPSREAAPVLAAIDHVVQPSVAPTSAVQPQADTTPADYSAFMRPPDHSADPHQ